MGAYGATSSRRRAFLLGTTMISENLTIPNRNLQIKPDIIINHTLNHLLSVVGLNVLLYQGSRIKDQGSRIMDQGSDGRIRKRFRLIVKSPFSAYSRSQKIATREYQGKCRRKCREKRKAVIRHCSLDTGSAYYRFYIISQLKITRL